MKTAAVCLLPLAFALAGCGEPPAAASAPTMVRTLVVGPVDAATARAYSGEVRARYEIPLAFRIGGKLVERRVDAGAKVSRGETLARLDPADVALQAAQADSQLALAQADAQRFRDLRAKNFVSAAALEAKETTLTAARSQAGIARNQAGYARLVADHAGVVAALLAEPGQVVAAGQPVLRLARDGEREVLIALPETEVGTVKVGDAAEITLWSAAKPYRGRLRELSPAADPASRTFAARVSLLDADAAVSLGMTATVRFPRPADARPVVPLAALFQQKPGSDGPAVWIVSADGTAVLRPVVVAAYGDAGAVIAGGLAAGERIVAAGVHKLTAGQKVRVAP